MISWVLVFTALLLPALAMVLFLAKQAQKSSRKQQELLGKGGLLLTDSPVRFEVFGASRMARFQHEPLRNVYAMEHARFIWQNRRLYLFGKTRLFLFDWYLPPLQLSFQDLIDQQAHALPWPQKHLWFTYVMQSKPDEVVLGLAKKMDKPMLVLHIRKVTPALISALEMFPVLSDQRRNQP